LNGEPGVYSARYSGENASDEENCSKLLCELENVENRKAHFECVLSIAVPSGPALTYEGRCDGIIIDERRGDNGFGYDPIFFFEELGKTFAQLSMDEKNKISHRGIALNDVKSELPMIKKWLAQRIFEEKPQHPDHDEFKNNDWSEGK
jgi:XTP/dITP diphosphohydrolase